MSRRPILELALASALVLGTVGLAGGPSAAATPPTAQQLQDAQIRVQNSQQALTSVQARAEQAAEAYNGAIVAASQAADRSRAAADAAAGSAARSAQAQAASDAAAGDADRAVTAAAAAAVERDAAEQAAIAAKGQLNDLVAGAYRSGGPIAFYSAMLGADPVTFINGQQMLNRVDRHQRDTLDRLHLAQDAATAASERAAQAQQAATARANDVANTAAAAAAAADDARRTAATAATALRDSQQAANSADTVRRQAQALVTSAEQELGSATASVADLAAKAEQARREAAVVAAQIGQSSGLGGGSTRSPGGPDGAVAGSAAATAVAWAYREIGVPYSWGGGNASGPTLGFAQGANTVGFDCSGLTLFAWAHAGVSLGHYTGSQWDAGRHVAYSDLRAGDLVFFANDTSDPSTIHHVGLYMGNGQMINAPHTGDVVRIMSVAGFGGYIGAVRLAG